MIKGKVNYETEEFNPYEHLTQSLTEDGVPAYTPYIKKGLYVLTEDGRPVYVPKVHIDINAYRDWFKKACPEGRFEIVRQTHPPLILKDKDGNEKLEYLDEVIEIKFYENKSDEHPKGHGFGRFSYRENNEFDVLGSAVSRAFSNGMKNMGFSVDLDMEKILDSLPLYVEKFQICASPYKETQYERLPQETKLTSSDPLERIHSDEKKASLSTEEHSSKKSSEMSPEIIGPEKNLYHQAALEMIEENNKEELSPSAKKSKKIAKSEASVETPVPVLVEDEKENTSPSTDEIEAAYNTVCEVDASAPASYRTLSGKTLRELGNAYITALGKPTLKWEGKITEKTRDAAVLLFNLI